MLKVKKKFNFKWGKVEAYDVSEMMPKYYQNYSDFQKYVPFGPRLNLRTRRGTM